MPSNRTEQTLARLADLTPRQIVAELDRYIVGQADAKKAVAIALRNRWRRQRAPEAIREEIAPNNIILDRKSTRLNSSHANISYAVFCLKKKKLFIIVS